VVRGRDLMHRWWSWRREINGFENAGTTQVAIEALRGIADLLEADGPPLGRAGQ
jgi:hypothetical protein